MIRAALPRTFGSLARLVLTSAATAASLVAPPLEAAADGESLLDSIRFQSESTLRWKLPDKLQEISGLARTPDGRLLAHEDQHAIIYELEPREGRLAKAFALGRPTLRGDFEGIAVADGRVYLVTSQGLLYEADEGRDGERVRFHRYDTGVSDLCVEVEGLAYDERHSLFLLACKRARQGDAVLIYRWSLRERTAVAPLRLARKQLKSEHSDGAFRPSGIEWDRASGHTLLISSLSHALAELDSRGEVVEMRSLPGKTHRQPEAVTLLEDGSLAIGDEGASRRARLTVYPKEPAAGP